ncbi:uncharacterized protein LOC144907168 [Branchiostoma floridae x Branchiostoma belcheri]
MPPSGAAFLRDEITAAYTDLKGKLDAAQAALEACRQTLLPEVQAGCAACVKQHCGDKAASCRPGLQGIISSLLEAALNDATGQVLEDLVGDVVYAPLVEDLAESLLPEVSNVVNDAVGTVWSGVQSVADVVVDAGEEVLNAAGEVVDAAGSLVSGVGEAVGGAIDSIGDAIGGIFGGRKRAVRSEPTCADLESQGEQACLQYADSSACHASCDVLSLQTTYCRTFNTAVRTMEISKQQHGWVTNLPQQQQDYIVRQVTVDITNAGTDGYVPSAEVKVTIFGDNYTLPMSPPPWDYSLEGRRIAEQALNIFKRRHPYTSN